MLLQYEDVPQTLVQKLGVAAVRGVARNRSIAEFQLEPKRHDPQLVDGMLAQLTADLDERKKFRVGQDRHGHPYIKLHALGEWCTVSLLMQCLHCVNQVLSRL